jgi:hypothetical protein
MKKVVLLLLFFSINWALEAQNYNTAIGLRLGNNIGLTINQHLIRKLTAEAIIGSNFTDNNRLGMSLILKHHHRLLLFKRFTVYEGLGGHYYFKDDGDAVNFKTPAGVTGLLGAEISVRRLHFSLDWKPEYHLQKEDSAKDFVMGGAFSIRYILIKRKGALERVNNVVR